MEVDKGVESVIEVTPQVFEMMLGQSISAGPPILDEEPLRGSDVTALVGFAGDLTGSVSIHCSLEQARAFTARMLGEPPETIKENEEIQDAMGELVNMIGGNVKDGLASQGHVALAIPSVIIGDSPCIRMPGARAASVPFKDSEQGSEGTFWVSLTFTNAD